MFDIGLQEMLLIGVLALIVFGPSKLPELGRMFGRAMREFRRASDEFRSTVETNLRINDLDSVLDPAPPPAPPAPAIEGTVSTSPLPSESEAAVAESPSESSIATATTVMEDHPEAFCAQRGSRLFHRSVCAWVRRIPDYERVYWKTIAEARSEGRVACPVCEPWEPA